MLNVLLQLLDDGRLTDGKGRTVDFKNTVVIMTSNLGSQYIAEAAQADATAAAQTKARGAQVMEALREHFRPEFLNRVDEIIFFHPLGREHMKRIIDIQLRGLMKRLEERKIHVELTDAAKDDLVREGLRSDLRRAAAQARHPAAGARPAGAAGARGRVRRGRHRVVDRSSAAGSSSKSATAVRA